MSRAGRPSSLVLPFAARIVQSALGRLDQKWIRSNRGHSLAGRGMRTWSRGEVLEEIINGPEAKELNHGSRQAKKWAAQVLNRGFAAYGRYILQEEDKIVKVALASEVAAGRIDSITAQRLTHRKRRPDDTGASRVLLTEDGRFGLPPEVTIRGVVPRQTSPMYELVVETERLRDALENLAPSSRDTSAPPDGGVEIDWRRWRILTATGAFNQLHRVSLTLARVQVELEQTLFQEILRLGMLTPSGEKRLRDALRMPQHVRKELLLHARDERAANNITSSRKRGSATPSRR